MVNHVFDSLNHTQQVALGSHKVILQDLMRSFDGGCRRRIVMSMLGGPRTSPLMADWVLVLVEILAKSSLVLVVVLQSLPFGLKLGFRVGVYDLLPTVHEVIPFLGHCLLLLLRLCLRRPPFLLNFRLHVLVNMPHAEKLRNTW